jgi:hypothetical protein
MGPYLLHLLWWLLRLPRLLLLLLLRLLGGRRGRLLLLPLQCRLLTSQRRYTDRHTESSDAEVRTK